MVRPVFFMENLQFMADIEGEEVVSRMPLPDQIPLQMVSVRDVGQSAAAALIDPHSVAGGAVKIAGDELTGSQIAAAIGEAAGKPGRYEALPLEVMADQLDAQAMFAWFTELPAYRADFPATRGSGRRVPGPAGVARRHQLDARCLTDSSPSDARGGCGTVPRVSLAHLARRVIASPISTISRRPWPMVGPSPAEPVQVRARPSTASRAPGAAATSSEAVVTAKPSASLALLPRLSAPRNAALNESPAPVVSTGTTCGA